MFILTKTGLSYFQNIRDVDGEIVAHATKFSNGLWGIVDINDKTIKRGVFKTPVKALKWYTQSIVQDN